MRILTNNVDKLPVLVTVLLKRARAVSGLPAGTPIEVVDNPQADDIRITLGTVKGYKGEAYKTLSPKQIVSNPQASLFLAQALQYGYLGPVDPGLELGKDWVIWEGQAISFKKGSVIALDIESAGDIDNDTFAAGRILSIALWNGKFGVVIPEELAETPESAELIERLCRDCIVVCHNGTFDMPYLSKRLGINVYHHEDTLLMHFVLDNLAGEHGLKPLARRWLRAADWDSDAKSYLKHGAYFENIPRDKLYRYNIYDAYWTYELYNYFKQMVDKSPDFYNHRMRVTRVLHDVQMNGVAVSINALDELEDEYNHQCDEHLVILKKLAGEDFNPQSPKQIAEYFASKGVSSPSFDAKHLKKLKRAGREPEFIDALLAYRYAAKVIGSFIANVRRKRGEDKRIHPYYLPHGAKTGRLSAKGPAIQTMGRDSGIKRALVAEPGYKIISCDYSQAELRTVAELADDKAMIAAFQPGAPDFFDDLMTKIWPDDYPTIEAYEAFKHEHPKTAKNKRALVKSVVYGLNYGRGIAAIATELEKPFEEAKYVVDQYLGAYPGLRNWQQKVRHSVGRKEENYMRQTKFGMTYNPLFVPDADYASTQNEALAFVPQSTANDICLNAAIKINEQVGQYGAKLIGLVHDATYVECPEETIEECSKMMEREMSKAATLVFNRVPFVAEAEVGNNWEEV
jgi:DNA polymerase-1